jgi:hypothetical protein
MATATNQPQPQPATFLDRAVPLISQFSAIRFPDLQAGQAETLEDVLRELNEQYCYVDDGDLVIRIEDAIMYRATNFREGGHMANRFFTEEVGLGEEPRRGRFTLGKNG